MSVCNLLEIELHCICEHLSLAPPSPSLPPPLSLPPSLSLCLVVRGCKMWLYCFWIWDILPKSLFVRLRRLVCKMFILLSLCMKDHWINVSFSLSPPPPPPISISFCLSSSVCLSVSILLFPFVSLYTPVSACLSVSQVTVEHCMVCRKVSLYMPVSVSVFVCLSVYLSFSQVTVEHQMVCRKVSLCIYICMYLSQCLSVCLSLFLQSYCQALDGVQGGLCICLYLSQCLSISLSPKLLMSIGWCAGRSLYMPLSVSVSLFLPSYCWALHGVQEGLCVYMPVSVYFSSSKVTVEHWMVCREVSVYACICLSVCLSVSLSPKFLLSIGWCAGRSRYICLYLSVSLFLPIYCWALHGVQEGISVCACICLSLFLPSYCWALQGVQESLSVYACICLSVCLSLFLPSYCWALQGVQESLSVYACICLSVCLSLFLPSYCWALDGVQEGEQDGSEDVWQPQSAVANEWVAGKHSSPSFALCLTVLSLLAS